MATVTALLDLRIKPESVAEAREWPCQPQLAPRFSFDLAPHSVAPGQEFFFDLAPSLGVS